MIDIAELIGAVQAHWASVVGVSPLPNVLADHCFAVGQLLVLEFVRTVLELYLSVLELPHAFDSPTLKI
jgi:hypothetical protein